MGFHYWNGLLKLLAKIAGKASNFSRQNTMQIWAFITTMDCKNQFQQTQNTDGLSLLEWTDKIAGSMHFITPCICGILLLEWIAIVFTIT